MKKALTIIAIIIAGGIILFALSNSQKQAAQIPSENLAMQGEEIPVLGRGHMPEGTEVTTYNSNPPTSGDHWPQPAEWSIYLSPLPYEQLIHNLEHGGIWISYKDLDNDAITELGTLAKK